MNFFETLTSEEINPRTVDIDTQTTEQILKMINDEDRGVPEAVRLEIPNIARAVDLLHGVLLRGGRMIYLGAGTSGRLGVLDASECPPTYGTPPEMVGAFIAGGDGALRRSIEGAEDDEAAGEALMDDLAIDKNCAVVGITASGTAPYVLSAMQRAKALGAVTIGLSTNRGTKLSALVDVSIEPVVGPEVIMGSTRMKSGTAQKLVLNMLSTAVMIRLGKVYGNLMVDLNAKNVKLHNRSIRMITDITGASAAQAEQALMCADGEVKTAAFMLCAGIDADEARARLLTCGGRLREALRMH